MTNRGKWIITGNIIADIGTLIYIIYLKQYNKILYGIQAQYENKIIQALNVVREPDFFSYFFFGILFAALLVGASIWVYRSKEELRFWTLILIIIHILFLIALVVAYSNPIFTTMITLLTVVGIGAATN